MPRVLLLSNPRSGSTYMKELLTSHPECNILGELLYCPTKQAVTTNDVLADVEKALSQHTETYVGFKAFPEQVFERGLRFDDLVRHIKAKYVIVLWREDILETLTSWRIAGKTKKWYADTKTNSVDRIELKPEDIHKIVLDFERDWRRVCEQWPSEVQPIFVRYEDLVKNPNRWTHHVFARMSCGVPKNFHFLSFSQRQNPADLSEKILNWAQLSPELKKLKFDARKILSDKIEATVAIPDEIIELAPDREPMIPAGGWRYCVAEPFMPPQLLQNVFDAINSGSVSSAGIWPQNLSKKLKSLFHVPVAQPCSNGFTALLLAMQAVRIGPHDEVIMPSMTMVAVGNAVSFLGAKPVFVDCMEDNYNPGLQQIFDAITENTKAVIVTHTYGVPTPNMDVITKECRNRGLWLIEDISECTGIKVKDEHGRDKYLGTFGHFACASMYINKMIHAGDGGFVIAKEAKFGSRLSSLVNHGFTPTYHFLHYERAVNAKINGLGAAMACGCLDEIDSIIKHRNIIADAYRTQLKSLPVKLMPLCGPYDTPWVFGIECNSKVQRTQLRAFLSEHGIETRDYFFSLHLQPAFQGYTNNNYVCDERKSMTNCEILGSRGFYLPTHSNLRLEDVNFITSVVKAFFVPHDERPARMLVLAPPVTPKLGIQVNPQNFQVEVRTYSSSGELEYVDHRGHWYTECVAIGVRAERCITHERWDEMYSLISDVDGLTKRMESEGVQIDKCFAPYIQYFKSQLTLEQPSSKPWLQVDLNREAYTNAHLIPTTSDPETLQLLVWLVQKIKPKVIWEIGCWFGHATYLMAAAAHTANYSPTIFACDAFLWQEWMDRFHKTELSKDESFKASFLNYVSKFQDDIVAVDWPYTTETLPYAISYVKPNLIFLDMTEEDEELEMLWGMIKPSLIPNDTVIVFNGLSITSIAFFTRHAHELVPIAKPDTIAKVFKYSKETTMNITVDNEDDMPPIVFDRKVKFSQLPKWDHHHNELFCEAIRLLHQQFHDKQAEVLFVPAVEEKICDEPEELMTQPWIGIIHSVITHKELFYVPDLQRLCSPYYSKVMKNCKGLFTLTKFQAKYLRKNLSNKYVFPVQSLVYPVVQVPVVKPSNVPQLWRENKPIDLMLVGSFARDFDLFFTETVPGKVRKVLLAGDDVSKQAAKRAPNDVHVLERLSEGDYEKVLLNSVIFLSMKYDGAANTLILECIVRNVPIVAPNLESVIEYLGIGYPLLYDCTNPKLPQVITLGNTEAAIEYLKQMDKSKFSPERFVESVEKGAVMLSLPPPTGHSNNTQSSSLPISEGSFSKFDVTICICSYKRTHHLKQILDSLWNKQDFRGSFQIIIWNNNDCRRDTVREISQYYIQNSTNEKSLELIDSTTNYYCSVRFAMPPLMRSDYLLICDDDIIPNENFVSFFMGASKKYPQDVLCLHGHKFLPHELNEDNPVEVWQDYENLRFVDNESPEELIHFIHADATLISKHRLQQAASVEMPDASFALVDDYWMSFVLNHHFGARLRKLSAKDAKKTPITETYDSNTIGLALHTRPEVQDARIRLYIHHMIQGWPSWKTETKVVTQIEWKEIKEQKWKMWDTPLIGMNIGSNIDEKGVHDLAKLGVSCVRIGAVGVGKAIEPEFSAFASNIDAAEEELRNLAKVVEWLAEKNICTVITLHHPIASASIWKMVAKEFASNPFVVGYDLINEPATRAEKQMEWNEVSRTTDPEILNIVKWYKEVIKAVKEMDKVTPIIVEPSYWGHKEALEKLPIKELLLEDPDLIVSFHSYDPELLTKKQLNKGRYVFPGNIPIDFDATSGDVIYWDPNHIRSYLQSAFNWAQRHSVKIFLGEFGICRDIPGAGEYLKAIMEVCKDMGMSGFLFSFRDSDWDAMDYELGTDSNEILLTPNWDDGLMKVVVDGIQAIKFKSDRFYEVM